MDPTQNNSFGNQMPVNMGYSGAPMNAGGAGGAGTGDIILAPEKKSKKWWIVGGVVGVVVLIIVAVCFLMIVPSKHRDSMAKMRQDWGEYYDYLMYGPESKEEGVTSETWYPLAIENAEPGEMGYEEFYNDYYATLTNKYEQFEQSVVEQTDAIRRYSDSFRALVNYNMIDSIVMTMNEKYQDGGYDDANNYIEDIDSSFVTDDAYSFSMYAYIRNYLEDYLEIIDYYDSHDCSYFESQSLECPAINDSDELSMMLFDRELRERDMDSYYDSVFNNSFFEETNAINDMLEVPR